MAILILTVALASAASGQVFVDINAAGLGDGSSWTNAHTTLTAGIASASAVAPEQVWVADGVYSENITMAASVEVYGGFEGAGGAEETMLSERDFDVNKAIIDAGGSGVVVTWGAITAARLDGLTVRDGFAGDGAGVDFSGADSSNALVNCTIISNETNGTGHGAGVRCTAGSSPLIDSCVIIDNLDNTERGGGIHVEGASSSPTVQDCLIAGNEAADGGGVSVFFGAGSPVFDSCIISGNIGSSGGGISVEGGTPSFVNCLITGNSGFVGGGVRVSAGPATVEITNCTVSGNTATLVGGGIYLQNGGAGVITNTIIENNADHGLAEEGATADPTVSFCLFANNPDGDYFDEGSTTLNGAASIEALAEASSIVEGDPQFVAGTTGTWSASVAPSYSGATNRTTLTVDAAAFTAGALVNQIINTDTSQRLEAVITANTTTTVEVVGDVTGFTATGETYELVDYHLDDDSRAVDLGTGPGGSIPTDDLEGTGRGIDVPGLPVGGGPLTYDIGAYEGAITLVPVELSVFSSD